MVIALVRLDPTRTSVRPADRIPDIDIIHLSPDPTNLYADPI